MPVNYQSTSTALGNTTFLTRVATTANIANLAGGAPDPLDGINLAVGDRILVKDQAAAAQNGIYRVTVVGGGATGTWVRATDFNDANEVRAGILVTVAEGAVAADTVWELSSDDPITIGATALTFIQVSGTGAVLGTGVAGRVAFWTAVNTISSDQDFKWDSATNFLGIGLGATAAQSYIDSAGNLTLSKRVTSAINYNVLASDFYIGSTAAPNTFTLPAADDNVGRFFFIKDEDGSVGVGSELTISLQVGDTIDGAGSFVMNVARGSITVYSIGGDRWVIL